MSWGHGEFVGRWGYGEFVGDMKKIHGDMGNLMGTWGYGDMGT
jgi:hypothetical protein